MVLFVITLTIGTEQRRWESVILYHAVVVHQRVSPADCTHKRWFRVLFLWTDGPNYSVDSPLRITDVSAVHAVDLWRHPQGCRPVCGCVQSPQPPPPAQCGTLRHNTGIAGADVDIQNASFVAECCALCTTNTHCKAYTPVVGAM